MKKKSEIREQKSDKKQHRFRVFQLATHYSLLATFFLAFSLQSCNFSKEKNETTQDVVATDSIDMETVGGITAAIKKDSLNPDLFVTRANIFEVNEDYGSAIKDMHRAMMLDSTYLPYYKYTAELITKSGDPPSSHRILGKSCNY
jgi:hypothetical protein